MIMRVPVLALGLVIFGSGIALAGDAHDERKDFDLAQPLAKAFNDETVILLFSYMRQSLRAAAEGKAAPQPPPELTRRMQDAAETLKRESANAAQGMLDEMEREFRQSLRGNGDTGNL
jgi:hypothetical protein